MIARRHFHCGFKQLALALPLVLAACTGTREARLAPARTSYFTVPVGTAGSVTDIARRYQVKEDDLLALNDIRDPNHLPSGGDIRIPAYAGLREKADPPLKMASLERPRVGIPDAPPAPASNSVPFPKTKPVQVAREPEAAKAAAPWLDKDWFNAFTATAPDPKMGPVNFLWPVKGRVISNFGASASGERNGGIDISAARGAPIYAAADGTVSYVGDELKSYGNLVLIRHDNGFITAYAHADSVTVTRGQHVTRGEVIATAGATGDVTEPQLHFELRAGSKAVNPQPYLVGAN
jgi:murein DD-endopeptidase MepM/ murein hydrolase activator NlpD